MGKSLQGKELGKGIGIRWETTGNARGESSLRKRPKG